MLTAPADSHAEEDKDSVRYDRKSGKVKTKNTLNTKFKAAEKKDLSKWTSLFLPGQCMLKLTCPLLTITSSGTFPQGIRISSGWLSFLLIKVASSLRYFRLILLKNGIFWKRP